MRILVFFIKNPRVISAVKLKEYIASTSIFGVIIGKFRYRKKSYLIILFKVDENSEVGFYYTILSLDLTIHLKIEGDKKFSLDVKEIA